VITGHVIKEVTYPQQAARLTAALQNNLLTTLPPGTHAELATFAQLTTTLGVGESAAIAAAVHRHLRVALEDKVARRRAESLVGRNNVLTTQQLVVGLIRAGLLTIAEADAIKLDWETNHRFAMPGFQSFGDLLTP
jgi:predicted nucleic acid-binding protein